jgi:DMSO/TMAO reductase YedYZ heme-binding membrane subunit
MIKTLIDLIQFLYSTLPLISCVAIFALFGILLSKSIKKHATVYYVILGLPLIFVSISFFARMFGFEVFNFNKIPFLGGILRDYIHMGTFGFPLLIIIMYTGALNPKITWMKKLLFIRKELSIISGFPVFAHSLIRVTNNFPNSLRFFTDKEEYMATAKITNEWGAGISNFSLALGIVLVIIFIPLWVTSFDSIHKRMGNVKWKKLQKWSYVLYALLFIHALGIQTGGFLNPREGGNPQKIAIENTQKAESGNVSNHTHAENAGIQANPERQDRRGGANAQARERHVQSSGFSDINVSPQAKRYIHVISLILIFGSYLYFRLRKVKRNVEKKESQA